MPARCFYCVECIPGAPSRLQLHRYSLTTSPAKGFRTCLEAWPYSRRISPGLSVSGVHHLSTASFELSQARYPSLIVPGKHRTPQNEKTPQTKLPRSSVALLPFPIIARFAGSKRTILANSHDQNSYMELEKRTS